MSSKDQSKNKDLENAIFNLCQQLRFAIINDFKNGEHNIKELIFQSYNFYQEEERNGVDYIFDITNKQDINCCDLEIEEIVELYNNYKNGNATEFFYCGDNYEYPRQIETYEKLETQLISYLDEIIEHIVANPDDCESHKEIYNHYVWENLINV